MSLSKYQFEISNDPDQLAPSSDQNRPKVIKLFILDSAEHKSYQGKEYSNTNDITFELLWSGAWAREFVAFFMPNEQTQFS